MQKVCLYYTNFTGIAVIGVGMQQTHIFYKCSKFYLDLCFLKKKYLLIECFISEWQFIMYSVKSGNLCTCCMLCISLICLRFKSADINKLYVCTHTCMQERDRQHPQEYKGEVQRHTKERILNVYSNLREHNI